MGVNSSSIALLPWALNRKPETLNKSQAKARAVRDIWTRVEGLEFRVQGFGNYKGLGFRFKV